MTGIAELCGVLSRHSPCKNINEEGDATAYVDLEFEEGGYAAILGGELFPNPMLVVWVGGKGKQSMSLNGDAAVPDWWGAY